MNGLTVPKALKAGDTIALISISGGRAGDGDMLARFEMGRRRLEETWGVRAVPTPNALKGNQYLYEHPEARGADLMWALENDEVDGIICNMGGDDSYRVLPYINLDVIRKHPKVFMGYSDISTWVTVFAKAGVRAYYGPNLLTPIAQPVELDGYTRDAITKTLFSSEVIGDVPACAEYTNIEWRDVGRDDIKWTKNPGYKVVQGSGVARGRLFGGCAGPLRQIMGTEFFPKHDFFDGCVVAIEVGLANVAGLHDLRALDAAGVFKHAAGLITGALTEDEEKTLLKFLKYEARREDLPVLANVDFVHRTPMTVLPTGAMAEIDCEHSAFRILESGVV